jgi:hypothetical protein
MTRTRSVVGLYFCVILVLVARPAEVWGKPNYGNCVNCHGQRSDHVGASWSTSPGNGSALNFGKVLVRQTKTATITVTNTTPTNLMSGFTGKFPAASGPFGPTTSQDLVPSTTSNGHLVDGKSASRVYTYSPAERGSSFLSVAVTTGEGFVANATTGPSANIVLYGIGVAPVSSLATTDAGAVRIGTTGAASAFVGNVGDGNQAGTGVGNLLGQFGGLSGEFAAAAASVSLADGGSQTIAFAYAPRDRGADSVGIALSMSNGSPDGKNLAHTLTANLTGTGVGPTFSADIQPGSTIDFGPTAMPGTIRELRLWNATTDSAPEDLLGLTLLSASITGPDAKLFSLVNFAPGLVLASAEDFTLQLAFTPDLANPAIVSAVLNLQTDEGAALGSLGAVVSYALSATVVPEPSSIGLLLTAAVSLATTLGAGPRARRRGR